MSFSDQIFLDTAEKLKESVRQNRSFEAAQVEVIGLDEVRRAAGASWEQIGDRIRTNSMHFIEGCLTDGDIVIPAGDGFLVIYASSGDRDLVKESAMLRNALNGFFLGAQGMQSLSARVERKSLDPRSMIGVLGNAKPADQKEDLDVRDLAFLPVWSVSQEAITGYWLAPILGENRHRDFGYNRAWQNGGTHDACDFLSSDLEILRRAVAATEQCMANGRRCLIGYSVHATTMANRRSRQLYLASLYGVAEALRPYFVARIAEIEPGTPSVTIAEWVHQIRPVSLRVSLELHESERALNGLELTGAFSAALVLPPSPVTAEARIRYKSLIQRWQPALRRQKLKFRIDNMFDAELAASAASSEVDFLSGDRLWPIVKQPQGVKLFSRTQFGEALTKAPLRDDVLVV